MKNKTNRISIPAKSKFNTILCSLCRKELHLKINQLLALIFPYLYLDYPQLEYQALRADQYDPVAVPVPTIKTGLKNGYRDPTYFRYSAVTKPTIGAVKPVVFDLGLYVQLLI